jgi:hypothetical protein
LRILSRKPTNLEYYIKNYFFGFEKFPFSAVERIVETHNIIPVNDVDKSISHIAFVLKIKI